MSMEDELGSIVNFCHGLNGVQVYTVNLPEDFEVPSMYFPPPIVVGGEFTSAAFMNSYSLMIKVFEVTAQEAFVTCEGIANKVKRQRWLIPMVDKDGTSLSRYIFVKAINTRILDHGSDGKTATAQLTIEWDSRYNFDRVEAVKMQEINIRQG